ncbi:ankyrin repeat domain-containing protein [Nitrosomonas marina]|uniref:Ankyrin repeat n=1 Tax=Nitrosomonas marina TaxID=917 RepID=A0A1H8GLY8_9PROT|nr:ankyrin repeat domain-containing protein [Nitrosomonas marina]SEN44744.1 Ankyrin repeat [Nitrosomonas marina]
MTDFKTQKPQYIQLFNWFFGLCICFTCAWAQAQAVETSDEELINAAAKGNVPLVKQMLDDEQDLSQDTINKAFFAGIQKGSKPIVQRLIERGADIEYRGDNGYTALIQAARDGRNHLVELLLPLGAAVNATATDTGETALILAAKRDRREVMQQLLAANADLNVQRDSDGMTALMLAARGGHQQATHMLLEAGANVDFQLENGATALMLAAQHGHLGVIYVLLAANADVNIKAENGATALTLANVYRHGEAAEMLKKAGAR